MNTTPQRRGRDDETAATQIIATEETAELDLPMSERFADANVESETEAETTAGPEPDAEAPTAEMPPTPTAAAQTPPAAPPVNDVPLYSSPQQPRAPRTIRPQGPSAGTIVLGVIVLLCGILTIAVGAGMTSNVVVIPQMEHFTAYLFAGVGVLLCVLALVWAGVSALRRRGDDETSTIHRPKGERID